MMIPLDRAAALLGLALTGSLSFRHPIGACLAIDDSRHVRPAKIVLYLATSAAALLSERVAIDERSRNPTGSADALSRAVRPSSRAPGPTTGW